LASIEAAEKKALRKWGQVHFSALRKWTYPLFSWHSFRQIVARSGPERRRPTLFDKA
jgi:hypothetical protein